MPGVLIADDVMAASSVSKKDTRSKEEERDEAAAKAARKAAKKAAKKEALGRNTLAAALYYQYYHRDSERLPVYHNGTEVDLLIWISLSLYKLEILGNSATQITGCKVQP